MGQLSAGEPRRASLCRIAGRAVVLAALGTGLWLGGQTSASAEELTPPATAVGTPSSAVDALPAPAVELLPAATSAVESGADQTSSSVAPAAGPAPAVAAPVAPVPVVPVVSAAAPAVHSALVLVTDIADPIVQATEPVLEVAAPVRDVAAPVVAAVAQAVPLVADDVVTLAGARGLLLAPVADALDPLLGNGVIGIQEPPDTDFHGQNEVIHGLAAGTAGAGSVRAPAGDHVDPAPGTGGAAGAPVPLRPATPATGGPAGAGRTGTYSFDQSPADLPAAVLATITAAFAATGDARDAAGNVASDPSFSPD